MNIFDLKLLTGEQLHAGILKVEVKKMPLKFQQLETENLVDHYIFESSRNSAIKYKVGRMGDAVYCGCPNFKFSGSACKHIGTILTRQCICCTDLIETGDQCERCEQKKRLVSKGNN